MLADLTLGWNQWDNNRTDFFSDLFNFGINTVTFTGHSLGGALAQYATYEYISTYTDEFDAIYPELAQKHKVALYPFFLEGVAMEPSLNLADGMHPNTAGIEVIVRGVLPIVISELNSLDL